MQATALAYSNIALVKYWGKRDAAYNLPAAGSISATLAPLATTTTVSWRRDHAEDRVVLNGQRSSGRDRARIVTFLDLLREKHGIDWTAEVVTENSFPTAAGLASSASGFAALALAATRAAELDYDLSALSALARRGSGSAARSLHGGFVRLHAGSVDAPEEAVASLIASETHWDLRVLFVLTATGRKKVSSTVGMNQTQKTSPYFDAWIASVNRALPQAEHAILTRDFDALTTIAEASALQMHASAIAASPGVLYWNGTTVDIIHATRAMREDEGIPVFFTIDAGPHVKLFTTASHELAVQRRMAALPGVVETLSARIGGPARVLDSPLGPTPEHPSRRSE